MGRNLTPQRDAEAIHKVRDGVLRLQNLLELIRIDKARGDDSPEHDQVESPDCN